MAVCPFASQAYRFDPTYPSRGYSGGPSKGILHTTESGSLPDYDGGAKAPHFSVLPIPAERRVRSYQHYDTARPSRALRNVAGGVQTNGDSAIQIELIGTTVATVASKTGWMHWASAPRWALDGLRELMIWIEDQHGIPAIATRRPWLPDGAGYGTSPARMTPAEWDAFTGWCGHMHVPENQHSDPGALDLAYLLIRDTDPAPAPEDDDMPEIRRLVKNLNGPDVWIGDGVVRRHIRSEDTLKGVIYQYGPALLEDGERLYEWADLDVLGEDVSKFDDAPSQLTSEAITRALDQALRDLAARIAH